MAASDDTKAKMSLAFAEDLWFGEFKDEVSEQAAARSMMAMAAEVYGVRPFPVAAQRLLVVAQGSEFDTKEVVKTIESDATLAARLLRNVNSAVYALPSRVATVQRAVTLLGAQNVRDIAIATTLLHAFAEGPGVAEELRSHAVTVAGVARFLAMQCHLPSDDVYVCALLHDLGKLLFLQVREEPYARLLKQTGGWGDKLLEAEREAYGFDHAVLGAHVLRAWGLPDPVPTVAACHHHPAWAIKDPGIAARLTSVVHLANLLSRPETYQQLSDDELIGQLASNPAAQYLNLRRDQIESIWHGLNLTLVENRPQRASSAASTSSDAEGASTPVRSACTHCGRSNEPLTCCARCQRSYCEEHAPYGQQCDECEAELTRLLAIAGSAEAPLLRLRKIAVAALIGLAVLAITVPPIRWIALLVGLVTLPILIGPLVIRRRRERLRQSFLDGPIESEREADEVTSNSP